MENKTGKYLKYAIGEIVLVVIGILIALWLNNLNQEKAKEEDFHSILMKIQDDIVDDTRFSWWLIDRYIKRDSLKDMIFSNAISYEQATAKEIHDILYMAAGYSQYYSKQEGYKQLTNNVYNVPEKYSILISDLNDLYITRVNDLERMNRNVSDISIKFKDYLANNEHWYAQDSYYGKNSDECIDFLKNSPRFKSGVMRNHIAFRSLMWAHSNYRRRAMEIYVMINEILGDKAREIPDRIRATSLKNEIDGKRFTGTYELKSGPDNTSFGITFEVKQDGKNLFVESAQPINKPMLLFYDKEVPWFGIESSGIILYFESKGKNTLSIITSKQNRTHWVKKVIDKK